MELLVAALPRPRCTMHLDTVVTMLDRDAFAVYPSVTRSMPVFRLRSSGRGLRIDQEVDLASALRRSLDASVRMIETGGDSLTREREQCNDASNLLALGPGVVVGYDHNVSTTERLTAAGIDLLTISGSELARGGGGARCLSCAVEHAPLA